MEKSLFVSSYFNKLLSLVSQVHNCNTSEIINVINILSQSRVRKSHVFICGNGGSAATADHFANDLNVTASGFRAVSLMSNSAYLTCLGNDFGYNNIITMQLKNLLSRDDVVIGISASGNSVNLIEAFEYANQNGAITIAFVGFDGGKLKDIAHHSIHISTSPGEYGIVEDVHVILTHLISNYLGLKYENFSS